MKRKHKKYSRPRKLFNKARIDEEAKIKKEFGLKNKREIWKTEAKVKSLREKAKKLISSSKEEQEKLFESLKKIGLNVDSIGDVLVLDKRDFLKRRLQTIVSKKLANTPKMARQLIVHKKVLINEKVVNSPSYIMPVNLENKITLKPLKNKTTKKIQSLKKIEPEQIKNEED